MRRDGEGDRAGRGGARLRDWQAGIGGADVLGDDPAQRELRADLPVSAGHGDGVSGCVVQADALAGDCPAVAGQVELRRLGDQGGRAAAGAERRAGHLLRGPDGGVDVQQARPLLVGGRVDVGRRAGQDVLDHGRRGAGAVVGVPVGLDHVGRGAGDERCRLAGPAHGLGRVVRRAPADAVRAGRLAAVPARSHEIDQLVRRGRAARGQGGQVVVHVAAVAVVHGHQAEVVDRARRDDERVRGRREDGARVAAVTGGGDDGHARGDRGVVRRVEVRRRRAAGDVRGAEGF